MGPDSAATQKFYRFTDADGKVHIVSSPDALPSAARGKAEIIVLNADVTREEHTVPFPSASSGFELQGLSFGVGFAAATILALVFRALPPSMRWVSRLAIVGGLVIVGIGLYFGYLRKSTGLGAGAGPLASPSALIQDAKNAVDQVQQRRRAQEDELRAIQAEGK